MNRTLPGILVMGALFLQPSFSFACSCKPPASVEKSFKEFEGVFVGRVLAQRSDKKGRVYAVQLQEVYKGPDAGEIVSIRSAPAGGQCGIDAVKGSQWLWYVSGKGKQYSVSLCSRTKELQKAYDEIPTLRTLSKTAPAGSKTESAPKEQEQDAPAKK